ncbi:MAG: hypothetical protein DLM64_14600 [Solirubrobacterales bacterium]|nr:MAG: hypothetical protein DLM64_14600 [Solirubrobacterales bacterium]
MTGITIDARRTGITLVVVSLAIVVGIGGAILDNAHLGIVGGVALVVAASLPLIARLRVDPLDGPGIAALITAFELGVVSLVWLGNPVGAGPGLSRSDITQALLVVALGQLSFTIGARSCGAPRPRRRLVLSLRDVPSTGAMVIASAVGVAGSVLGVLEHSFGYVSGGGGPASLTEVFALLQSIGGVVALTAALLWFGSGERRWGYLMLAFTAIQFAIGFLSGVKAAALAPLVFVLLAYVVAHNRVPVRSTIVLALIALLVVVPLAELYRSATRTQQESAPQALSQAFSSRHGGLGQALSQAYRYGAGRFRNIDSVALIVARTPSVFPFAGGKDYFALPAIILVPRALWPQKPSLTTGGDFSHTYWEIPSSVQTATPLTQTGDLYRNFGLVGVVVGMLLWGLAVGAWQRLAWRLHSPRFAVVFIYSLVYTIAGIESDLPELIAQSAKALPAVALVAWLLLPGSGGEPGYRALAGFRAPRRQQAQPEPRPVLPQRAS